MHIQGRGLLVWLVGGVLLAVVLVASGVDQAKAWVEVIAGYLTIASAIDKLMRSPTQPGGPLDDEKLDRAVADLADAVQRQWEQEAWLRSLQKPIRIKWSIVDDPRLANMQAQEAANAAVSHKGVVPEVGHVVQLFRKLPIRQIVVLGDTGAGKTVLALRFTLDLLDSRRAPQPVPVLLSASSWDPNEDLKVWMTRRLLEDYPALANVHGSDAVKKMVDERRVMVVLDGLDEIPAPLLPKAIRALDFAVSGAHPVLVTCRGDAYASAVEDSGEILKQAAVLKIQPIGLDDAATFLTAPERPSSKDRWDPVIGQLRSQPNAPLAQVLTSPLMVSLAATAYVAPKCDPAELLGFPDEDAIEYHLLEVFIPAVYHNAPPEPGTPTQGRYSPDQARKWLTFLARHLDALVTNDLAWWQLVNAIPRRTRGISVGLVAGLLFGIAGVIGGAGVPGLSYRLEGGLVLGVIFSMATGRSYALSTPPEPLHFEIQFREKLAPFVRRFVPGLGIGVVVGLGTGLPYLVALTAGPVFGVALAVWVLLAKTDDVTQRPSPRIFLTQDRTAAFFSGLAVALPVGLLGGLVIGFPSGPAFGVIGSGVVAMMVGALVGAVAAGILGDQAYGPVGRRWFAFTGLVVGGLVFEPTDTAAHAVLGPAYGLTFGLAIGFIAMISRACGSYAVSLLWLALRGDQPWRLMQFLDDAHHRGVLRRSGATYQFRHDRVRKHLASPNPH